MHNIMDQLKNRYPEWKKSGKWEDSAWFLLYTNLDHANYSLGQNSSQWLPKEGSGGKKDSKEAWGIVFCAS